jgi:hypothetical protein
MKHFCDRIKGMGAAVCVGGWICAIYLPKRGVILMHVNSVNSVPMHGYRNVTQNPNFTILLFPDTFWVKPYPLQQKKGGVKISPQRTWCVGLFAGQKWCISGNPGNTLSDHRLGVGSPSKCSQGMTCQVSWSGMLDMGRGGQRQLRLKKNKDVCSAV